MVQRVLIEVSGIVQGVGFRPHVYSLATALDLRGFVQNRGSHLFIDVEGEAHSLDTFLQEILVGAPGARRCRSGRVSRGGRCSSPRFRDRSECLRHRRRHPHYAGHRHVRRLPRGALRSGEPTFPISFHQLHELRAAVHDRDRDSLRSRPDDHAPVPHVRGVRARVPRSFESSFSRRADCLPALRTGPCRIGPRIGSLSGRRRCEGDDRSARRWSQRRHQRAGRVLTSRATRRTKPPWQNFAGGSAATRSRSRSWCR